MSSLFQNLKKRKVFTIAAVYAVVAWLTIQIVDVINDPLNLPDWFQTVTIVLFAIGFPIALLLAWAYEVTPEGIKPESGSQTQTHVPQPQSQRLIYATFILALLAVGFQIADRFLFSSEDQTTASTSTGPESQQRISQARTFSSNLNLPTPLMTGQGGFRTALDISPDGDSLYYAQAAPQAANWKLNLRDNSANIILAGENIGLPIVSPDGDKVLLISTTGAYVINADGSSGQLLRRSFSTVGWYSNDELMLMEPDGQLSLVSTSGVTLETLDANIKQSGLAPSLFLERIAGSNLVLFSTVSFGTKSVYTIDLASNELTKVADNAYYPRYANSSHILFMRGKNLWAVAYNEEIKQVEGPEAQVVESIETTVAGGIQVAAYTVSDYGRLVYLKEDSDGAKFPVLAWTDLQGRSEVVPIQPGNYTNPRLSPDGNKVAVTLLGDDVTSDIWVYEFEQNILGRRTFSGGASRAIWSTDSEELFYQDSPALRGDVWRIKADGTGQQEMIYRGEARAQQIVPDEGSLLVIEGDAINSDISSVRYSDGVWVRESVLESDFDLSAPSVSPDGRWLMYVSEETGQPEVYVRPYPNVNERRWQVSSQGGRDPVWSPTGDGVFYYNQATGTVLRSEILPSTGDEDFRFEEAVPVTRITRNTTDDIGAYSISADGNRVLHFLAADSDTADPELASFELVENWFQELQELAPVSIR